MLSKPMEQRAAAYVLYMLRGDLGSAEAICADGPVSLIAMFKAMTAACPVTWLDPDTALADASRYLRSLDPTSG